MAEDVEIIIGADSSKLQREVRDATAELDRLRNASDRLGRSSAEMDAAIGKAAKRLDDAKNAAHRAGVGLHEVSDVSDAVDTGMARLAKGAALTGDAFGSLAGPIGDVGDAFAMMPPAAAAAVVAFGALIGAGNALIANALEVIDNLDDYSGKLGDNEEALRTAKDSVDTFRWAQEDLSITLAAAVAPAISDTSLALAGLVAYIDDTIGASNAMEVAMGAARSMLIKFLTLPLGTLGDVAFPMIDKLISYGTDLLQQRGEQEQADMRAARAADEAKRREEAAAELTAKLAAIEATRAKSRAESGEREVETIRKITRATDDQTEATRRLTKAQEESAESIQFLTEASEITVSPFAADVVSQFSNDMDEISSKLSNFKQHSNDTASETANVWEDHAGDIANYAASFATSISGMITELARRNTAESRKERLKQFRTMKAAAIVEATINTALAATSAFAQGGGVPVGLVLAGLTIAAGAVEIGMIASQQPNFHRGGIMRSQNMGLAGDERSFSATTRANEAVVLTQQAIGAFAGQLSRANAGEPMGGGMAPVYVMVDGRAAPTRQFARPDPMFGRRRLA